jgi:sialate O-acetylesterase
VVCYGPEFLYFEPEGGCARVFFRHAQGLRSSDGQTSISGFAVAGKDRVFHAADAHLEGETVVVSAAAVAAVYAVRYAFRDYCEVNLVNSAGLPALPFRTDGMSPN